MRDRRPSRHLGFHRLMDVLQQSGCPMCRSAAGTSRRWLQELFHEQVNDLQTRQHLRRGGAFCSRHTAQALQIGDPLGSSILYGDLLRHALEVFPPAGNGACPLCEHEGRMVHAMLDTLLDHIEEEDVRVAYKASDGLCLPHLRLAVERCRDTRVDLLLAMEREEMTALAEECDGFIAKSDYLNEGRLTEGEEDAWRRAARKLGGGYGDREA